MNLQDVVSRSLQFERDAHRILGTHEAARSRVILLEETYRTLGKLSLKQDDLFRQALRCAESGLYRAAYVMSWAAFMDFLEEILEADGFAKILAARPKWTITSLTDLREHYPESQIIDAMRDANVITRNEWKALQGLLNSRNECAHPSEYYPDLNTTLGYISDLLKRLSLLRRKFFSSLPLEDGASTS